MATAPTREADAERTLGFDALYRSCRDDVHAYVAGLLRDRHAAEDVTALAFERAYRRRRTFREILHERVEGAERISPASAEGNREPSGLGRIFLVQLLQDVVVSLPRRIGE